MAEKPSALLTVVFLVGTLGSFALTLLVDGFWLFYFAGIGLLDFFSALCYYFNFKKFLLRFPLAFELQGYDLSIISGRVYGEATFNGFFAELIRLAEKKALFLKLKGDQLEIEINRKSSGILPKHQKLILQTLKDGLQKTFFTWKEAVDSAPEIKNRLDIELSKIKATKKSLKYFLTGTIFGFFVSIILLWIAIYAIGFFLLFFISKIQNKSFPTDAEYRLLDSEDKKKVERLLVWVFLLFFAIYFILVLSAFLFSGLIAGIFILLATNAFVLIILPFFGVSSNQNPQTKDDTLIQVYDSIKQYSELENQEEISYFLMFGEYAAWALALKMNNTSVDPKIQDLLLNAKIKLN